VPCHFGLRHLLGEQPVDAIDAAAQQQHQHDDDRREPPELAMRVLPDLRGHRFEKRRGAAAASLPLLARLLQRVVDQPITVS
jgi:hypothetical protein